MKSLIEDRLAEQDDFDVIVEFILDYAYEGNTERLVDWIGLEEDFEIDGKDADGWTALMLASLNGYIESVDCRIGYGADLNVSNKMDLTALIVASQYGQ